MPLDPFKAHVIQLAPRAAAPHGFALAGGNALVAHGLLTRPTQDIDLFTNTAQAAPQPHKPCKQSWSTTVTTSGSSVPHPTATSPNSTSPAPTRAPNSTSAETGEPTTSSPSTADPSCTSTTPSEPTTALLGRALPRDFLDIAAALGHYSRQQLLELAFTRDPGLRPADAALAAQRLDSLEDKQFQRYGLSPTDITALRARFATWPREPAADQEAEAAHRNSRT